MARILVIKLGALGDFVQALGPMQAIRRHHANDRITLLTTQPFADFAAASGMFDTVWTDDKPKLWRLDKVMALRRRLNEGDFQRVYDLQTSDRSGWYYRLFSPKPEWSGVAAGCSHPHANPDRDHMHTIERQAEQLHAAGIDGVMPPDLSWADADVGPFNVAVPFVLLVPGGAPHRPAKRWPAEKYGALAARLAAQGTTPVLLGTDAERTQLNAVQAACPTAANLCGRTGLLDIAALSRRAAGAVGNDTGPMHLIAATGCPSVVLYSHDSDPALCAQRGKDVTILREADLARLPVETVLQALA